MLQILHRPVRSNRLLVLVDEDVVVFAEETIHVFEGAVRSLGVEKVDDGQEGRVEDDPNDVESPAEGLDADGCDLNNYKIETVD